MTTPAMPIMPTCVPQCQLETSKDFYLRLARDQPSVAPRLVAGERSSSTALSNNSVTLAALLARRRWSFRAAVSERLAHRDVGHHDDGTALGGRHQLLRRELPALLVLLGLGKAHDVFAGFLKRPDDVAGVQGNGGIELAGPCHSASVPIFGGGSSPLMLAPRWPQTVHRNFVSRSDSLMWSGSRRDLYIWPHLQSLQ
jgi:hypothetical protein